MNKPKNNKEAIVLALALAITAPTNNQAIECMEIAEDLIIQSNLTANEINEIKKLAEKKALTEDI